MEYQSTITAFQATLHKFKFEYGELTFSETFAIERFKKKFQKPDASRTNELKREAWLNWEKQDSDMSPFTYPGSFPELWRARESCSQLKPFSITNNVSFPKGSEAIATHGLNSVEQRLLSSDWTCTADAFPSFVKVVCQHKGLKRAFRRRYSNWYSEHNFDMSESQANKYLFDKFFEKVLINEIKTFVGPLTFSQRCSAKRKVIRAITEWKLRRIVLILTGGRFSSVPKNNTVRRPILIECFGNMILQKLVGDHFRSELLRVFQIDLNALQEKHREMISCDEYATIDLKSASDLFHLSLIKWFLPRGLFKYIELFRSTYVTAPNGARHYIHKVSSMGNGFTFELMTWILTCVVKQLDPNGSVYGDDIICKKDVAPRLIELLERMGLEVNKDKSFISGPFRESCGGNFHDEEGYVESYDFHWPETIHDCITTFNKVERLSQKYKNFSRLRDALRRHVPKALQGPCELDFYAVDIYSSWDVDQPPAKLSNYFRTGSYPPIQGDFMDIRVALAIKYSYRVSDIRVFFGMHYTPDLASPTKKNLSRYDWAKYEMYLHSGRRSKDIITGRGCWARALHVDIAGCTVKYTGDMLTPIL